MPRKQTGRITARCEKKITVLVCNVQGALGELFVTLLKKLMFKGKKAVHLIVDGLPAHKKAFVNDYVASTPGQTKAALPPWLRAGPQAG